jgi:hypothetical protein
LLKDERTLLTAALHPSQVNIEVFNDKEFADAVKRIYMSESFKLPISYLTFEQAFLPGQDKEYEEIAHKEGMEKYLKDQGIVVWSIREAAAPTKRSMKRKIFVTAPIFEKLNLEASGFTVDLHSIKNYKHHNALW